MNVELPIIQSLHKKLDQRVVNHCKRVGYYSLLMGKVLRLSHDLVKQLYLSALIHDIGKLGIRDEILFKPGPLTPEEHEEVKHHSLIGDLMVKPIKPLLPLLPFIRHHHEKIDGSGYPDGLKGSEIPQLARIIAITDSFDAMTSQHDYRSPLSVSEAVHELDRCKGTQFDSELIASFIQDVVPLISQGGIHLNLVPNDLNFIHSRFVEASVINLANWQKHVVGLD